MWELKSKNAFIRFPRNGSGWGKTFVWTECKIWARQMSDIFSCGQKGEMCECLPQDGKQYSCANNILQQTKSSCTRNILSQQMASFAAPVFYWWQMLWGLQCSTYIPMKIYKSQSNQAEWNKSSFLNVFISQFKGSTVLEDNGLWTRQKSSTNSASASAVEQQE